MKKIATLSLSNFKFFGETVDLKFNCKNVLVYGENGSGKSSLYWALYTFLQSSYKQNEEIIKYFDISHTENLLNRFVKNQNSFIQVELEDSKHIISKYSISKEVINTNSEEDNNIKKANIASDFINHRLLTRVYDFRNSEDIDLWDMFEIDIIEFIIIDGVNLKHQWKTLSMGLPKNIINGKMTFPKINSTIYTDYMRQLTKFNETINDLLNNIIELSNNILNQVFREKIVIRFDFSKATFNDFIEGSKRRSREFRKPSICLKVEFLDCKISKPHTFLNEAKLTAIALSIRFAILKRRVIKDDILKILVLDDLLISLDMTHRLKVVNFVLNDVDLDEYQKFILTHDRGFYNLLSEKVSKTKWEKLEFYNQEEKPFIKTNETDFEKACRCFEFNDLQASANYLRKETENILKRFLDPDFEFINKGFISLNQLMNKVKNEINEEYRRNFRKTFKFSNLNLLQKLNTDFENDSSLSENEKGQLRGYHKKLIKFALDLGKYAKNEQQIFDDLESIKKRILNPLSHNNEVPIFSQEIQEAIDIIKELQNVLRNRHSKKNNPA